MIPPTPTPFPTIAPADMPFEMPQVSLWNYTGDAVQAWHMTGATWTTLFQAVIIIGLVIFGIFLVVTFLRRLSNDENVISE